MTYIALLRGINVGGNKMVAMADLKKALAALGFTDVSTLLQSGNAVFCGKAAKPAALEALLEKELAKRLKVTCDVHVRTAEEWSAIIAANPFEKEAKEDPGHLLVTVYRQPLDTTRVAAPYEPERKRLIRAVLRAIGAFDFRRTRAASRVTLPIVFER